ncbi:hypothetical protein NDU88_001421 [Pleurodeles waltl]|uniref:Uncharacterized protein n=1 Tax=Pleurodeles waltl TaxID=8319 RepID=A0AAV7SAT0_PLEWA|nr:hypothetical protein NDU88_001421 [Pleurodeles waltl]
MLIAVDGIRVDYVEVFDFLQLEDRAEVDFFNIFLPWGVVFDNKEGSYFMLTDVTVVYNNGVIIMGEGGAVNIAVTVVAVGIKPVIDDALSTRLKFLM